MWRAIGNFRARRTARKVMRDVDNLAAVALAPYLTGPLSSLDYREEFIKNYRSEAIRIITETENPPIETRHRIAESASIEGKSLVLGLPFDGQKDASLGTAGCPGISGKLRPYLRQVISADAQLAADFSEALHQSDDEIAKAFQFRYVFHRMRRELFTTLQTVVEEDADVSWCKPLVKFNAITYEYNFRSKLGLQQCLSDEPVTAQLMFVAASTFLQGVLDGQKTPLQDWKVSFEKNLDWQGLNI